MSEIMVKYDLKKAIRDAWSENSDLQKRLSRHDLTGRDIDRLAKIAASIAYDFCQTVKLKS